MTLFEPYNDGTYSQYIYDVNNKLIGALGKGGLGATFTYDDNRVTRIDAISTLNMVASGETHYSTTELTASNIMDYASSDRFVQIRYNNYKSTTISEYVDREDGILCLNSMTYLFDNNGRVRTTYKNEFDEENPTLDDVILESYDYQADKVSLSVSNLHNTTNYFDDVCFGGSTMLEVPYAYFGDDLVCGDELYLETYLKPNDTIHSTTHLDNADDLPTIYMSVANLAKLLSDKPASLILGGWAKADSLYVISDDEDNLLARDEYPSYVASRQFSFIVRIIYEDGSYDFYQKNFDWMNTDWQYNAMVITPNYNKNIASIQCHYSYANNHGTMYYTDPTLCECSFEKKTYIDDKVDTIESSHSKWITKYFYDDEDRVTEVSYIDSTNTNNTYTNKMYYNKNGVVYKQIDYKGIVTEKVFNDNGMEVQTKTYHTDHPAEVFYTESKLGENGETLADYNELGEEINSYEYVGKTSKVARVTDKQGNKTAYGYDTYNDTLLQMTTDVDGVSNTNTYTYSDGYLTKVSHNDLDITYDYDHQGRLCKIYIGDKEYVSFGYEDNSLVSSSIQSIQTTTYNNGECFKQVTNKDGNVTKVYYIPSDSSQEILLLENIYDSLGNLIETIEHTDNTTQSTYYYRDKFGNINLLNTTQHGVDVVKESIFDDEGNQTELTYSIEDLDIVQAYEYTYTFEPESTLNSIALPIEDMYQNIALDNLGRTKEVNLLKYTPDNHRFTTKYDYLKRGNHTSNLVSNIRYGLDDKCTDYLSYKYDDRGNITEVYENNLLVCRYFYDALSRLIREDNKLFGKTYTWSYDAGGNILNRFEYEFTLRDELR